MCGIAGFINNGDLEQNKILIEKMVRSLKHRGPDDDGVYINQNIAFGHARLSIIDLTKGGHQPMFSDDKDWCIIFNGEIYNFKELRKELIDQGHSFRSNSDTEVILKGFIQWKEKVFVRLNGIFSLAIWRESSGTLWLARDRFGVKPLYVTTIQNRIAFASEIKALLILESAIRKISFQGFHEFLYYGNSLGIKTLYNKIFKVQPGYYIKCNIDSPEEIQKPFWIPEDVLNLNISTLNSIEVVQKLLEEAVQKQLVSDVPVGIFLSGGIDSSCITAFAARHYPGKLKTFTAAFDFDCGVNELEKSARIARLFRTDHHELYVKSESLPHVIESLIDYHDEPFSDAANIPLYLLSKELKHSCKVILQGDGGDELFAGYRRYEILAQLTKWNLLGKFFTILNHFSMRSKKLSRFARLAHVLCQTDNGKRMALLLTLERENVPLAIIRASVRRRLISYDPFEEYVNLDKRFNGLDIVQKMLWSDTQAILPNTFLEKVDKSTMANSIEVRVPFLENNLANYVMRLPSNCKVKNGEKKWLLKRALRGILPDYILDGPKTGFGVPYSNWLKKPLLPLLKDSINSSYIKQLDVFDYSVLDKMIVEHAMGKLDHGFLLWKIMNFSIWAEKYKITFEQ
jgi:asparagine synthase (glutamine-hydrolysing)